jgi:hypothetical protein
MRAPSSLYSKAAFPSCLSASRLSVPSSALSVEIPGPRDARGFAALRSAPTSRRSGDRRTPSARAGSRRSEDPRPVGRLRPSAPQPHPGAARPTTPAAENPVLPWWPGQRVLGAGAHDWFPSRRRSSRDTAERCVDFCECQFRRQRRIRGNGGVQRCRAESDTPLPRLARQKRHRRFDLIRLDAPQTSCEVPDLFGTGAGLAHVPGRRDDVVKLHRKYLVPRARRRSRQWRLAGGPAPIISRPKAGVVQ